MKVHTLQLHPKYYEQTKSNFKTFDIRPKEQNNFQVGDIIHYVTYDANNKPSTKYEDLLFDISFIVDSDKYLKDGYVVLGIKQKRKTNGLKPQSEMRSVKNYTKEDKTSNTN
ncbi:MAG: DUF3850 domain-containing protein [Acholeplasmatales bacterium]|jgi:hypothetical protein|nr:DUF3850 domain-containing protein [Acholeplasmatales bacterium]